jgi:hypothetical protein
MGWCSCATDFLRAAEMTDRRSSMSGICQCKQRTWKNRRACTARRPSRQYQYNTIIRPRTTPRPSSPHVPLNHSTSSLVRSSFRCPLYTESPSVNYNEDLSAFHGPTLDVETSYVSSVISYTLSLYPTGTPIIVMGHSMGGIVATSL